MTEAWEEKQKAHRVLEAAVAEAGEKPEDPVFALPVMRRADLSNKEFRAAARYLGEQSWISERADDYEVFVVTPEGMARATGQTGEARDEDEGTQDEDEGSQDEPTGDDE